jgi:hypothetical protein
VGEDLTVVVSGLGAAVTPLAFAGFVAVVSGLEAEADWVEGFEGLAAAADVFGGVVAFAGFGAVVSDFAAASLFEPAGRAAVVSALEVEATAFPDLATAESGLEPATSGAAAFGATAGFGVAALGFLRRGASPARSASTRHMAARSGPRSPLRAPGLSRGVAVPSSRRQSARRTSRPTGLQGRRSP